MATKVTAAEVAAIAAEEATGNLNELDKLIEVQTKALSKEPPAAAAVGETMTPALVACINVTTQVIIRAPSSNVPEKLDCAVNLDTLSLTINRQDIKNPDGLESLSVEFKKIQRHFVEAFNRNKKSHLVSVRELVVFVQTVNDYVSFDKLLQQELLNYIQKENLSGKYDLLIELGLLYYGKCQGTLSLVIDGYV